MRILAFLALAALAACGGTVADGGDAGDGGPIADAIVKKDVKTFDVAPEPDSAPSGGLNVSGEGPGYESEDQIAVAPDGTIAILWSAFSQVPPYVAMNYAFSTDDGKTFSAPQAVQVGASLYPGDPSIAVDAQGNFWASYLGIDYEGQSVGYSNVYVAEAPKGSATFGAPVLVSAPANTTDLNDHPKIFATKAGTLLVGWADYPNSGTSTSGTGVIARSTDGTAWTRDALIAPPDAQFGTFFWFCEGDSSVYTAFLEAQNGEFFAGVRSSADDGATFTPATVRVSGSNEAIAALDPACVASGSDVWVLYATTQNPAVDESTLDGADHVYLAHSGTAGATFDPAPIDVLDHAQSKLATLPILALDASGELDVAYAAGDTAGDANGSIRFTRTAATQPSPSVFVDGPMEFDLSREDQAWLGDYFGGVVHAGAFYLAYPRNETGLDHIYFAKMALP